MVRVKDGAYAETLRKVKGSGAVKAVSEDIVGLSRTRDGDLLVRLNPKNTSAGPIAEAIGSVMGAEADVREMNHFTKIVIQDMDDQADSAEIVEAICDVTDARPEEVKIILTRELSRGQKWVVVSLSAKLAKKTLAAGKLRVGFTNCRLRLWEERGRGRCPRCLGFGHNRDECKGPDRGNCCRECGVSGHQAASCSSPEDTRAAFKAQLSGKTPGGEPSQ